jgi:hypothetical protein
VVTPYTTGAITGRLLNPYAQIGTGEIAIAGEPFVCSQWTARTARACWRRVPPGERAAGRRRGERASAGD